MTNQRQVYADRQRCEAAGLKYDNWAIGGTLWDLEKVAAKKDLSRLDKLSSQLNLQIAAYLESMYERAGVISGGAK